MKSHDLSYERTPRREKNDEPDEAKQEQQRATQWDILRRGWLTHNVPFPFRSYHGEIHFRT